MAVITPNSLSAPVGGFDPDILAGHFLAALESRRVFDSGVADLSNPAQRQAAQVAAFAADELLPWTTSVIARTRFGSPGQALAILNRDGRESAFDAAHPGSGPVRNGARPLPVGYLAAELAGTALAANVAAQTSDIQALFGRQARRKNAALKALEESDLFREELRQIIAVKSDLEKQRTALNRIGDTLVSGLKQCSPRQAADRLRSSFDKRNNLALLNDLNARAAAFAPDIQAAVTAVLAVLGTDDAQARGQMVKFVQSLSALDQHADAAIGEDARLKLIKTELLSGLKGAGALDIAEKLRELLNPQQKTLFDVIDGINAEARVFDGPIAEVLQALAARTESAADALAAQTLIKNFKASLDALSQGIEKTAHRKVQEGLVGLLAQQRSLGLDLTAVDINEEVDVLRRRVADLQERANYLARGFDLGNERVLEFNQSCDETTEQVRKLNSEISDYEKQIPRVKESGDLAALEKIHGEIKSRRLIVENLVDSILVGITTLRAEVGELDFSGTESVANSGGGHVKKLNEELSRLFKTVQEWNSQADPLEKEAVRIRATHPEESRAKKELARTLREQAKALTDGRMAEIKAEIQKIQGPVAILRDEARLLTVQANAFADAQIGAFYQAVQRAGESAGVEILEALAEEGAAVSELVRDALYYGPEDFEVYLDDVTAGDGELYKARRRQYYELLAVAAKVFRDAVEADRRRFNDAMKKGALPKPVSDKLASREKMYDGMTLAPEIRAAGRFYDDMPADLDLPDRIPLFARPKNPVDKAYLDTGELPRFFDLALGTAVMFDHAGEVLPADRGVALLFHGAGTENSSINSLGLLINKFTSHFTSGAENAKKRDFAVVGVSNFYHEFGPHDPAFARMDVVMRWTDAIVERYLKGHGKITAIAPARSLGGNLAAQYAVDVGRVPVIAQSMYNPTPYCTWFDLQALKSKGRKMNENALKLLEILDKQWTFHLADGPKPRGRMFIFSGLKDDYLQETPAEYPQAFLDEYPEFKGVKPTDLGLKDFLESVARRGGEKVELVLFPNGGHFLFNEAFEDTETIAAAFAHYKRFVDLVFG